MAGSGKNAQKDLKTRSYSGTFDPKAAASDEDRAQRDICAYFGRRCVFFLY